MESQEEINKDVIEEVKEEKKQVKIGLKFLTHLAAIVVCILAIALGITTLANIGFKL